MENESIEGRKGRDEEGKEGRASSRVRGTVFIQNLHGMKGFLLLVHLLAGWRATRGQDRTEKGNRKQSVMVKQKKSE